MLGRLQPGVGHVVAIAHPGHGDALERVHVQRAIGALAPVLQPGEQVGQDLARVEFVGQAVDHRHPRMRGKALDLFLPEGADHHDVGHAADDARAVLDRFERPSWLSPVVRCTTLPPSWYMPASKLTRVRVLAFSKIMARMRSVRVWCFW
jgi:hypothetical protein